jgi:uncharacterized protein (TIGR02757 family)
MDHADIQETRELLDEYSLKYNTPVFIQDDPIRIPHQFESKENIEIAGFFAATLAWGRRDLIIRAALELIGRMDNQPYDFLLNLEPDDLKAFRGFKYRTFSEEDCVFFVKALRRLYVEEGGLYQVFLDGFLESGNIYDAMVHFRNEFLVTEHSARSRKHIADPSEGSAAKRLNLFLRWMVRRDEQGVDFGIWTGIPMSALHIPLDVHTGSVARELGILRRRQNDWRAVRELTYFLRKLDPEDPVRFDYGLFGLGIEQKI